MADLIAVVGGIGNTLVEIADVFLHVIEREYTQDDYALAGPAK